MKMRIVSVLTLFCLTVVAAYGQTAPSAADRDIRVMTRNLYHGVDAEIFAVPGATTPEDLYVRVAAVYEGYFNSKFPERAAAIAREIAVTRPELIGLQEAILVRTQYPADGPATSATTVVLDFLQTLLDAMAAEGIQYDVVVQSTGFDAELPSAFGFDVRHTDREVILARSDLDVSKLKLSNAQAGNFVTNCSIPSPLVGPIVVRRGWASIDVKLRGTDIRFLTTHLDGDCLPVTSAIQQAQAAELLNGPAATRLPVIFVGDLNSTADSAGVTYNALLASGFADTWLSAGFGPGFTCCQAPDLLNGSSQLNQRIDFVLLSNGLETVRVENVGDQPEDKTLSGRWPSDHAGVVATIRLPHSGTK